MNAQSFVTLLFLLLLLLLLLSVDLSDIPTHSLVIQFSAVSLCRNGLRGAQCRVNELLYTAGLGIWESLRSSRLWLSCDPLEEEALRVCLGVWS